MKQYTTPTVAITIDGAEELLASARHIIVTFAKGDSSFDVIPTVDGNRILATLTQKQTSMFAGEVKVEATIVDENGSVSKTDTLSINIEKSIRRKVIETEWN